MKQYNSHIKLYITTLVLLGSFVSCLYDAGVTDIGTDVEKEPVDIIFGPVSGAASIIDPNTVGIDPDIKVTELRIIAFKASDGLLVFNEMYDFTTEFQNPIAFQLDPGTYDFIFIGNEKSDTNLSDKLAGMTEGITTLANLYTYNFAATAFADNKNIPMSSAYYNIIIDQTDGLSEDGGTTYQITSETNPWEVEIERLAIRIDATLHTESAFVASEFTSIRFSNVPDKVYIQAQNKQGTPLYNSGSYESPRTYTLNNGDNDSSGNYAAGFILNPTTQKYEWKKTRIILPSTHFAASTTASDGIQLTVNYSTLNTRTAALGPITGNQYTIPRNHHILLSGELYSVYNIGLKVEILKWKSIDVPVVFD